MKSTDNRVKNALIRFNVLSEEELATYLQAADENNLSLKDYLLQSEIVTEKQILIAVAQTSNLQLVNFDDVSIESDLLSKIPVKIAWYYKIIPIKVENNVLFVASTDPLGVNTLDEIRMHVGYEVEVMLAPHFQLIEAFKKYYGFASDTIDKIITKEPSRVSNQQLTGDGWVEDIEQATEDPTVSHLVNQILLEAYQKRATDIHIEPYRDKVRFRYRIDGVLVDANLPTQVKHFIPQILSRIKILANISITEKRIPQDGSAVVKTSEQQLDLRVSTLPTPRGESMVIRILPTKVRLFSLEKLGFESSDVKHFRSVIKKPHGIVFITGPTGSGKTTTLYACLNEINSPQTKIITIEDPVEYEMEGITQVQVNNKVNFTFSTGLRSVLRHDPDIIMVGEVRDLETAEISIRTALTGHLVFSTLHTNDASSGVTRLIDMGIEPYLVASSVEAFVAQRLVRNICPKCKIEDKDIKSVVIDEIADSLKIQDKNTIKIYKGTGCDYCNQTGFYGRQAIYEILNINDALRAAIIEKPRSDYIKRIAVREGMKTLRQNGWEVVLKGQTTPTEVLNVTGKDKRVNPFSSDQSQQQFDPKRPSSVQTNFGSKKYKKNQRSYPRIEDHIRMRYRLLKKDPKDPSFLLSDGIEYPTHTIDISAAGLRFTSKEALEIGSILEIKIQLGSDYPSIDCLAKVCRVEEDEDKNVFGIVTYYLDISSADRTVINKYVESISPEATAAKIKENKTN